jgi:hypothetical protein
MEIDRAQIEQRMSFTRENYRMVREKLMEIMYWDKDAYPSRRLRSSIGCRRKSSPSSSIRSKAQCTVVGSAPMAADQVEHREAAFVAHDGLAINQAGTRW